MKDKIPRIKEEALGDVVDELIERSEFGCIIMQPKGTKGPVVVYHVENYDTQDLIQILGLLDVASQWFRDRLRNIGELD